MSFENKDFAFGDFRLDAEKLSLTKDNGSVPLTPKALKVLIELLKKPGDLVTKEDLMSTVWRGSFVEDGNLTFTIRMLRKALDDDAKNPRFIETIPRRGYKFVGRVEELPKPVVRKAPDSTSPRFFKSWPLLFATAVILLGSASWIIWLAPASPNQQTASEKEKVVVAILPFQNLTGDASQEYLSDGLTEEMIARLGNLAPERLAVIGRTSVMHYKGSQATIEEIGRDLQVKYVLEGSVRRDGDRVRIAAQLIQTKDQTRVWSQEYDRELTNLLDLQDEIARGVAHEIESAVGENDRNKVVPTSAPKSYEVYDLYLKGQYFFNKRGPENLEQAISYFDQAVNKDPGYGRAYAGLAESYALFSGYTGRPQSDFVTKARAAAQAALEIDPELSEAHTAMALVKQNFDWDWPESDKEFRRAIELDPNYATAHHWFAEHLALLGRFDEALHESEIARQLDPLSMIIAVDNGEILYFSRKYDGAIERLRSSQEFEPGFDRNHIVIHPYVEKRMFREAIEDLEEWKKTNSGPWIWAELAFIYGRAGQQQKSDQALKKLLDVSRKQEMDVAPLIWAYAGMGNNDQAMVWLEKAYKQHSNILTRIKVDPAFDSLRGDPRFQDLVRRVRLA